MKRQTAFQVMIMYKFISIIAFMANVIIVSSAESCIKCKNNEVLSTCMNGECEARNCSQLGMPLHCDKVQPEDCIEGCVCKEGYLWDDCGVCINKEKCPSCGNDPNAMAGCGVFCERCSNYKSKRPLACPRFCKLNGCECKPGYIYDGNRKKCVKPCDCTPTCKEHEVYSDCVNRGCEARNCTQLGYPLPCEENMDPEKCIKGCICERGYLRAENGTCIPESECPSCGGDPNATAGCGVFCLRCQGWVPCPKICRVNGCDCKKGFVYDENIKKCVKKEDCTPVCKENEEFDGCINGYCGYRRCSELGGPMLCVDPPPDGCVKGCTCKKGYLRADNGTCVPEEECPCRGDPNAQSGCDIFCVRCSNYKQTPVVCSKRPCYPGGCECRDGFIYDDVTGKCVKPCDCTPPCPDNEMYSQCANGICDAKNCSELGKPVACPDMTPDGCTKGCVCINDYVRADNGTCIPKKSCPACNDDPNAEAGCGGFCTRCDNYKSGPVACPEICMFNACDCKKGYIYDQNIGKCVRPCDCTPVCKTNEVYSECINGGCLAKNCSQLGKPVPCIKMHPDACIKGCVCAEGFLRADNGTCVPVNECPSCNDDPNAELGCGTFCDRCSNYKKPHECPIGCMLNGCQCKKGYIYDDNTKKCVLPCNCTPTCKANEMYSECINGGCLAKNCSQLGKPVPCIKMNPDACIKGCICAEGYLRADNGTCIPVKECPSCNDDPNAELGCGIFCDRRSNYNKPHKCLLGCMLNGCQCKKGYIYDDNTKKCVLPCNCTPTCKANEVYSDCMNSGCLARNCSQLGKPLRCEKISPDQCIKGCVCADGYIRADNGTCIPVKECPSCNDDPNAESGCGNFCDRCSNYNKPHKCPIGCILNGCQCRKGHIYDDNTKKCVLPCDCTPTCKANEEYSTCANGLCRYQNCSDYGKPLRYCPRFEPDNCKGGCVCKPKYLKNDKGLCIPEDECPEAKCSATTEASDCEK